MFPQSPVIPNKWIERNLPNKYKDLELVFAKDQPEYNNLPAIKSIEGEVITRWNLTFKERLKVLLFGNIYLRILTFHNPLQPILLDIIPPEINIVPIETKNNTQIYLSEDFEEKLA